MEKWNINQKENENRKEKENKWSPLLSTLTSREHIRDSNAEEYGPRLRIVW